MFLCYAVMLQVEIGSNMNAKIYIPGTLIPIILTIPTVAYANPNTDSNPATVPMVRAPTGSIIRLAEVPTATPPASVAFWMWTWRMYTSVIIIWTSLI